MITRRHFLRSGSAFGLVAPLLAHAPYPQWNVYRKRFLLILTSRTDPEGYELGKAIASYLAEHLPESHARVARAPDPGRIASLLSTRQVDVALVPGAIATALLEGQPPFDTVGPIPLKTLKVLGDHRLISHEEFPEHHTHWVKHTLAEYSAAYSKDGAAHSS